MTEEKNQPTRMTFEIHYDDGTVDVGKPSSWKNLEDIEILQSQILKLFVEEDTAMGSLVKPSNKQFWDCVKKMAALVPIVGKEEIGFDPDRIDSMDELCRIFITTQEPDPDTSMRFPSKGTALPPSEIARVNCLNFQRLLREGVENPSPKKK
jgi:hypothetical protein